MSLFFTKKSLFAHCSFDNNRKKYDYYIGYDCMKKFVNNLKNMQQKITNCEKLKILSLTDKGSKLHKKITMFAEKKN